MKKVLTLAIMLCMAVTVFAGGKSEAAAPKDVTLTFYGFSDWVTSEPYAAVWQAAKAQFEAENPGYKAELQSDPYGDWDAKYKTMFAAGNPADIFMVNNPDFPTFANSGNLLNMDTYAGADYFSKFFPGVQGMYQWQGANMGMAFTTDCRILWYNKAIFAEAGLDPESPPTTWAELQAYALQITQNTGKYGFGMDLGLVEFPMQGVFNASNASIIKVAPAGDITPNADTPEFRAYLAMLLAMKPSFEPDYATLNQHDVARLFAEGQMGMIVGNTLADTTILTTDWYGQALLPKMNASAPNGSFGGGFGICVSSKTAAPAQAVKFAQILTSAQYNAGLIGDIPANQEALDASPLVSNPNMAVYLDQIQYARQAQPKTLYYADIDRAAYDAVVSVVVGGTSIDDAIAALNKAITDIVE
ncbi:MAG: extracellular solute-binding protein [Spirochaetaceae bacterium]|jgi:multiple sugar transport system substrate-binding protein|nr:extracellular solute-binding protein [Spirochaetaceae bacterium]